MSKGDQKHYHGLVPLVGIDAFCVHHSHSESHREDRFGRMFPQLPPSYVPASVLHDIGAKGGPMDDAGNKKNSDVAAGMVIFGQFIDHDITLDTMSNFEAVLPVDTLENVRTPTLDLDCIYGDGPEAHPYLYRQNGDLAGAELLTGQAEPGDDPLVNNDLLRSPNGNDGDRGSAIIGDPRNDENRIVSQMQLGMIRFHNQNCRRVIKEYQEAGKGTIEGKDLYEEARRKTTWHYQWAVVFDFLVAMCGRPMVENILTHGRQFYCPEVPFIPVEFSVAAYRFGHSMVPQEIATKQHNIKHKFFGPVLGRGFSPVTSEDAIVNWSALLDVGADIEFQRAVALDTQLASDLLDLPFVQSGVSSLATRNLLRGNSLRLPAGETVAVAMDRPQSEIDTVMAAITDLSSNNVTQGAPLWLYILAEAEVIGRETAPGVFDKCEGLGPVGARIVAEVLIGLQELDSRSFLGANRNWRPDAVNLASGHVLDTIGKILFSTQ